MSAYTGAVPGNYETHLGPVLFEPYALQLARRVPSGCMRLLEIACGTGRVTRHLLNKLHPEGRLVATDLNADMLELARSLLDDVRIDWSVADAQELPFPENSFDTIACGFGAMFFPDKRAAFRSIHNRLEKGGQFWFSVWDSVEENPRAALIREVLDRELGPDSTGFLTRGPYSFYDPLIIRELLADAGFSQVSIETVRLLSHVDSSEGFMTGFIDGSPLGAFLRKLEPPMQERIRTALIHGMEKWNRQPVPMQAHLVGAFR